jgi:type IV pilus assembly protein PilQ
METQGKGKIISTPKVATLDNVKATIQQGDKVPYPQQTEDGISVAYAEATLKLEVTPHISPDEKVGLLINIKKQQADWEHTVQGAPTITTKEAETEVLVSNGETLAIGGIIVDDNAWSQHEVPWFSKIPVLGWLFRSKYNRDTTTELLIFITPKILKAKDYITGAHDILS